MAGSAYQPASEIKAQILQLKMNHFGGGSKGCVYGFGGASPWFGMEESLALRVGFELWALKLSQATTDDDWAGHSQAVRAVGQYGAWT